MSDIFDEDRMMEVLGKCIPDRETFLAGIHGITLQVNKKKTQRFDVYIGITEQYLLVAECIKREFLNELYSIRDKRKTVAEEVGTCFLLTEIESCVIKKGILGAVNCSITWKNGNFLKLQMPKLAGLGGGMPHHAKYREMIIARLSELNCGH